MPAKGKIFAFLGLIASGKSTLAGAWAKRYGLEYYNSDVVRKGLAGLRVQEKQQTSFAAGIYTPEFSRKTYDALLNLAETELAQGRSVVLDASYQDEDERQRVKELAHKFSFDLVFIQCLCPEDETRKRLERRANDPNAVSDGRWEIYLKQKENFRQPQELQPSELIVIDTNVAIKNLLKKLAAILEVV